MTGLSGLLREATERLRRAGVASPRVDAELLAAHVLAVPRGRLLVIDDIPAAKSVEFLDLVEQRSKRVPLQHLTGVAPFLGLELAVGPGVFIPRPETELLAQWAIDIVTPMPEAEVVDLGSGSGALALAIAAHCPNATVRAVERSPAALEWLQRNTSGTRVEVIAGDIRDVPIPGPVDLVVANPPYVPAFSLVPDEISFDPEEAVFAGEDGLDLIPEMIARAASLLRPGGRLGFEHDDSHDLVPLMEKDFEQVKRHLDLAGRPRYTTGIRRG
ncbi:MAG TPA: peptide chain release factor N(5)-glutamine methyltransferase [Candidatus Limnocylindrales bacterium]|nr:peptide chain release factor N(5)-glutamine methyltransferase [Candidatus Limnocylindrales bacterium]